ncbi:MAG: PEP-CTERM sorting domain-containing protein [Acidobacteria bacterium]|nr:PEP-CTERM sorting domain-containing protein [Acidobacteriota bacterium]
MRKSFCLTAAALLLTVSASASPIVGTNYDTVVGTFGNLIAGPTSDVFVAALPPPASIGTLENWVYFDSTSGLYTYVHLVTPTIPFVSKFNTGFGVEGFNGVAGWSWSDALAAGGLGTGNGFMIDFGFDKSLDWVTAGNLNGSVTNTNGWGPSEGIHFFFQSTYAPATGDYNIINGEVGTAVSYAPAIPEPSTVVLFGGALALFAIGRRRQRKS